jgi:uncharacterized protein YciI
MLYAVLFEDNPDRAEARERNMQAHLAFLERNGARIRAAGPLREAPAGAPAGGLWLVEAPDAAAVRALCESDPFWPTGLRRSIRICEWRQVFAEGTRRI